MAKLNEDINDIIIQFMDRQTRYMYSKYYYQTLLEETDDYEEYRKNMRKTITEYWDGVRPCSEKLGIIEEHCQIIYEEERV